jgi:hypothetical protein
MAATRYVPLPYAKPKPWYRRRGFRWALLVLLIAVVSPLIVQFARFGANRWRVHRLYQACAAHAAAADTPVYDEDPADYTKLSRLPQYSTVGSLNAPAAYLVLPRWKEFCAASGAGQIQSYGTLFLGELRTPAGKRRLVGVDITGWFRGGKSPILSTHVRIFEPTPAVQLPPQTGQATFNLALGDREGALRLFAGQRDPKDPSHFTIAYTIAGQPGLVDGWLKEDGTVLLEPR